MNDCAPRPATLKRRLLGTLQELGYRRESGFPPGQTWRSSDNRVQSLAYTVWVEAARPSLTLVAIEAAFDLQDLWAWRELDPMSSWHIDYPSCLWTTSRQAIGDPPSRYYELTSRAEIDGVVGGMKKWLTYLDELPDTWLPWYLHAKRTREYLGGAPLGAFRRLCGMTALALYGGSDIEVIACLDRVLELRDSGLSTTLAGGLLTKSLQARPSLVNRVPAHMRTLAQQQASLGEAVRRFLTESAE